MASFFRSLLGGSSTAKASGSQTSQQDGDLLAEVGRRMADIEDAMEAAALVMNDDAEGAEARLKQLEDPTSFHLLGLGVIIFMRSIIGFEKEIMAEAAARLSKCEEKAWQDKVKAENRRDNTKTGQLLPPGSEFALVYCEAVLMSAIVGLLHQKYGEAAIGFIRLRRCIGILKDISAAEAKLVRERGGAGSFSNGSTTGGEGLHPSAALSREMSSEPMPGSFDENEFAEYGLGPKGQKQDAKEDVTGNATEDEDLEFLDASEDKSGEKAPTAYAGQLGKSAPMPTTASASASASASGTSTPPLEKQLSVLKMSTAAEESQNASTQGALAPTPSATAPSLPTNAENDASIFTHPIDIFTSSGTKMCLGIILLLLTSIPPTLSTLFSLVGYKGDKEGGLRLLWRSTPFQDMNGAIASMVLLGYYNGLISFADILPTDRDVEELSDDMAGYPRERCEALLQAMRLRYPESRMWPLEEARIMANTGRLREAVEKLEANTGAKMQQVAALNSFELAINSMTMMDWTRMKAAFLRCVELNNWSHSLYYFVAGYGEVEMYRDAVHALARLRDGGDGDKTTKAEAGQLEAAARQHKKAAAELLRTARNVAGKTKVLGRVMPFEVFVVRKLDKWEARAKRLKLALVDAIGVSPAQEMIYIWSGPKRMPPDIVAGALAGLEWGRCTAPPEAVAEMKAEVDEMVIYKVCRAALLRRIGDDEEAGELLREVLKHQSAEFTKDKGMDDWVLPAAHHEVAALAWNEVCQPERWPKEDGSSVEDFRRAKTAECLQSLEISAGWKKFVLDARIGMRVQPGLETVRWFKKMKGW